MANLEKLIADHAYWSDKREELRRLGVLEIVKCNGMQRTYHEKPNSCESYFEIMPFEPYYSGVNCIQHAFNIKKEYESEHDHAYYNEGLSYEEIWEGLHEENNGKYWEPCEHCKKVRELKKERGKAGMKLGQIRGAITRAGRKLNEGLA